MKQKSTLALIELAIMLAVFAISAAICLQIFAYSAEISEKNEILTSAVVECKNTAEVLRHTSLDLEKSAAIYGGEVKNGIWQIDHKTFTVTANTQNGEITAHHDGEIIFTLKIN